MLNSPGLRLQLRAKSIPKRRFNVSEQRDFQLGGRNYRTSRMGLKGRRCPEVLDIATFRGIS